MTRAIGMLLIMLLFATPACDAQRSARPGGYDLDRAAHVMDLGKRLKEVSGLATDSKGRLFAHDDERGVVYRLDPMTGSVLSYFILGRTVVTEDFEGLAIAGKYFFLVTSAGDIYMFREGPEGGRVEYRVYSTSLGPRNDVEGLCYDPATESLLLACKGDPGSGYKGKRAVYSFDLVTKQLSPKPRFLLDEKALLKKARGKDVRPSAIERHPKTGNFFVLAAQGETLIELSPEGKVIAQGKLDKKRHDQPEGLTFLPDGAMLISDEGKKHGTLSRYARPR
jgi:uncharacterized protein YjiK